MQVDLATMVMIQVVATIGIFIFTILYFSKQLKPFERLGTVIDGVVVDDSTAATITNAANSLIQIGTLAQTGNAIMQDEEMFENLLNTIAQKAVKIFQMSILGSKSGDSRKLQKAEGMVNEAMITGMQNLNPVIGMALKATGLDEELRKDPEMFQYIMQIVMDKGLLKFMDPATLGIGGDVEGQQQVSGTKQGINF